MSLRYLQEVDGVVTSSGVSKLPPGTRRIFYVHTAAGVDTFAQAGEIEEGGGFQREVRETGVLVVTAAGGWSVWYSPQHWQRVVDDTKTAAEEHLSP